MRTSPGPRAPGAAHRAAPGAAAPAAAIPTAADAALGAGARRPRWARFALRLAQRPLGVAGLTIILVFALAALGAAWISPADPLATDWSALRQAPSARHWLGTDELGRDMLSRVIWGTRASLLAGALSILIAMGIGVPVGALSGFYRGLTDVVIMRLTDAWLSFPFLILAIGMMTLLGPSLFNATLAIGIGATPAFIRLSRGQVLAIREEDYVTAARALGASDRRILALYVLPNLASVVLVQATVAIPTAIIAESVLSFLGLGVQPPQPSWGTMLNSAQSFLDQAPWMAWFPGLCIFLVALAFNLAGDGLRDALDPKEY